MVQKGTPQQERGDPAPVLAIGRRGGGQAADIVGRVVHEEFVLEARLHRQPAQRELVIYAVDQPQPPRVAGDLATGAVAGIGVALPNEFVDELALAIDALVGLAGETSPQPIDDGVAHRQRIHDRLHRPRRVQRPA